jgi:hypothetical protein
MKRFKSADFFLQTFLLILLVIALLISNAEALNPIYPIAGFALVQLISIIVHGIAGAYAWKMSRWRKIHQIGMLLVFVLLIVALVQGSAGGSGDKDDKYSMSGLGTLILAVVPAILFTFLYFIITCKEWVNMKKAGDTFKN